LRAFTSARFSFRCTSLYPCHHFHAYRCTGEHELYDITRDPLALNNLLAPGFTSPHYSARDIKRFAVRLDALLSAWYTCAGAAQ
jgi:arylsulfatase